MFVAKLLRMLGNPADEPCEHLSDLAVVERGDTKAQTPCAAQEIRLTVQDLDAFVVKSDALGGPGAPACKAYWEKIGFAPATKIDVSLDPFGDEYCAQQLALYREVSGREFDQAQNELMALDVAAHARSANPYDHPEPRVLAGQMEMLACAFAEIDYPPNAKVLDMGCGWGLSCEFIAYLGYDVTAVDINPDFVELVSRRARERGLKIEAKLSSFDAFQSDKVFDCVFFYECLHHSYRPWKMLRALSKNLSVEGCFLLAGEPIHEEWWPDWGLRLDPLSLYCIRKYGWFETGWSERFLLQMFARIGFKAEVRPSTTHIPSLTVVARRDDLMDVESLLRIAQIPGAVRDGSALVFHEDIEITLTFAPENDVLVLDTLNHRQKPLAVVVRGEGGRRQELSLRPGRNSLRLEKAYGALVAGGTDQNQRVFRIEPEFWSPAQEFGSADDRRLSFHIAGGVCL